MTSYPKTKCATCQRYFTSTGEFDAHRTGRYGVDRHCLSAIELIEGGWVSFPAMIPQYIDGNHGKVQAMIWARQKSLDKAIQTAGAFRDRKLAVCER